MLFVTFHQRNRDFNPRSPHGERLNPARFHPRLVAISIHAPRTGSDPDRPRISRRSRISIHAPRTGSDKQVEVDVAKNIKFQSTLPARGATHYHWQAALSQYHFNPRSPHGERPACGGVDIGLREISIHAPRTGSDAIEAADDLVEWAFQSTLPARGATQRGWFTEENFTYISIHAPRTGSDSIRSISDFISLHFNPRSPHGERRFGKELLINWLVISIHAPRTGSDSETLAAEYNPIDFNPRSPHGERPRVGIPSCNVDKFQSTLPARGATADRILSNMRQIISIHAPRTGSDA